MDISDRQTMTERLLNEYGDDVFRLCRAYFGQNDAEDALQETFIKLHTSFWQYNGSGSEKNYVLQVARNTCKDMLRRRKTEVLPIDEMFASNQSTENDALFSLEEQRIIRAVYNLPEKYKSVIIFKLYSDTNDKEIAKALGIGGAAFRSRLFRARKLLKKALGYEDE